MRHAAGLRPPTRLQSKRQVKKVSKIWSGSASSGLHPMASGYCLAHKELSGCSILAEGLLFLVIGVFVTAVANDLDGPESCVDLEILNQTNAEHGPDDACVGRSDDASFCAILSQK